MITVAFCLLSYAPNEPAGIERSVGSLAAGCRGLGVRPLIIAAGPPRLRDEAEPGLVRLRSLSLPAPIYKDAIVGALADPAPVLDEVHELLDRHGVDVVCWVDALWGLGYLAPAPTRVQRVLMVHKVRGDDLFRRALASADLVCPVSDHLVAEAKAAGLDTSGWHVLPNALLVRATAVGSSDRQHLRNTGPVRIVTRAEPYKGIAELLQAIPERWSHPVEIVLGAAGFEYWSGMQDDVIRACRSAAGKRPDVVRILEPLPWAQVPGFFAGAAATVISSYEPETFCNTAAEALSVGTPVVGFGIGNLPALVGPAGEMVPLDDGPAALWEQLAGLLGDARRYRAQARAATGQVADHSPVAVMSRLLSLANCGTEQRLTSNNNAHQVCSAGPPVEPRHPSHGQEEDPNDPVRTVARRQGTGGRDPSRR